MLNTLLLTIVYKRIFLKQAVHAIVAEQAFKTTKRQAISNNCPYLTKKIGRLLVNPDFFYPPVGLAITARSMCHLASTVGEPLHLLSFI